MRREVLTYCFFSLCCHASIRLSLSQHLLRAFCLSVTGVALRDNKIKSLTSWSLCSLMEELENKQIVTDINISLEAMISAMKENNWMRWETIAGKSNLNWKVRETSLRKWHSDLKKEEDSVGGKGRGEGRVDQAEGTVSLTAPRREWAQCIREAGEYNVQVSPSDDLASKSSTGVLSRPWFCVRHTVSVVYCWNPPFLALSPLHRLVRFR